VPTRWAAKEVYYGIEGWVWNFVIHPSFLIEVTLFITASIIFLRARYEKYNEQLEKVL
jgi:hypothetical protein